jgi:hypothetical protein
MLENKEQLRCKISGSASGCAKNSSLLERDAMSVGE